MISNKPLNPGIKNPSAKCRLYVAQRCQVRTRPSPKQRMRDKVLWFVRVGSQSFSDVLDFGGTTSRYCLCIRPTIVHMSMSSHVLADQVTHHRRAVVLSSEFMAINFYRGASGSINSPASLGHRTMTCLVFLLYMSYRKTVSILE